MSPVTRSGCFRAGLAIDDVHFVDLGRAVMGPAEGRTGVVIEILLYLISL